MQLFCILYLYLQILIFKNKKYLNKNNCRGVEQLAARQAHNLEVAGSSPAPATKLKYEVSASFIYLEQRWARVAQLVRARES